MEKMSDLRDLLRHEIYDLYSAEEQIIKALPAMIEKANNAQLKTALRQHLDVTKKHMTRLDQVQSFFIDETMGEKKGLLARLFKRNHVCRGMQGLIEEGEKIMDEEMSPEVLDAAIVACTQKMEHYEICGYGTARAFAKELNLTEVTQLLEQTLNEEYQADDRLTELAVGRLNQRAETGQRVSTTTGSSASVQRPVYRATTKELEMEMASNQAGTSSTKKQTAPRSRGPRGEAERSESPRQTSSARRTASNSSNARSAKTSSRRKTTDSRGSKTKRSR